MTTSRYTHQVIKTGGNGRGICSSHTSETLARKAMRRLVAMSRGELTDHDFEVVPTVAATHAPADESSASERV